MHKALMGWIKLAAAIFLWILDINEVKKSNSRDCKVYVCHLIEKWTFSAVCVEAHGQCGHECGVRTVFYISAKVYKAKMQINFTI